MARKKDIAADLRKRNLQNSKNLAVEKKGMELPVNTLVVVAIAVIVILAIAAFFMGGFGGTSKNIQNQQAFMNECSGWVQTGCSGDASSDLEGKYAIWQPGKSVDGAGKVLDTDKLGGLTVTNYLKTQCGCFGTGTGTGTSSGSSSGTGLTCSGTGYVCRTQATCLSTETKDTTGKTCLGDSICCKTTATAGTCTAYPSITTCPSGKTSCTDISCIPPPGGLCCK